MKEEIEEIKKQLNIYKYGLLIFWILIFLIFYIFRTSSNLISTPLSDLSAIGSFFNVVTSLTGVITVFLLAKAVIFQKEELLSIKEQMRIQKESIEEEEKINRTIKLIDDLENIMSTSSKDYLPFIEKILFIHSSKEYENKIDFPLLKRAISRYKEIIGEIKLKKRNLEGVIYEFSDYSEKHQGKLNNYKANLIDFEKRKAASNKALLESGEKPISRAQRLDAVFEDSNFKPSALQNIHEEILSSSSSEKSNIEQAEKDFLESKLKLEKYKKSLQKTLELIEWLEIDDK